MTLRPKFRNGGTMAWLLCLAISVSLFASPAYAEDETQGPSKLWEDSRVGVTLEGLERVDAFPSELKIPGESYKSPEKGHDFLCLRLIFVRIEGVHVTSLGGREDEKPVLYDAKGQSYRPYIWSVKRLRLLDTRDITSPSEFVEGGKIMLLFEFPKEEKPARLAFIYYFKETWEGENKKGRIDITISGETVVPAYARSPEDARKELEKLNVPFTSAEFMERAEQGDAAAVKLFLDAGMNPDAKQYGMTALILAARNGHTETAKALLAKGADVNAKRNDGATALILAAQNGHTDIAEALLAKGADVNAKANNGKTALIPAAQQGHTDIVKTLLAKGADVNAKANDGATALIPAAQQGHTDIVKTLLAKGADVNAKANDGVTALILAAYNGHTEIVEVLLAKGADVHAKRDDGWTALLMASQNGHPEIAEALLAKGADVNAKTNGGHTALIQAAQNGHTDIAETLLAKGADVNAKRNDGATALILAAQKGHTEIVQLLKEAGESSGLPLNETKGSAAAIPPFNKELKGSNEVRVRNPNDFSVNVGVRSGDGGKDFQVPSNGTVSVFVPDGKYDIYFIYSSQPEALFQGDSFTLNRNGVEIQIVKVVDGNYDIRRIK